MSIEPPKNPPRSLRVLIQFHAVDAVEVHSHISLRGTPVLPCLEMALWFDLFLTKDPTNGMSMCNAVKAAMK